MSAFVEPRLRLQVAWVPGLQRYHWFVLLWFIVNLVQISFTELTSDEGYYWFYSQKLQWGYYDHPPMIALLISIGSKIVHGEAGVRLLNLFCMTGAVWIFFQIIEEKYRNATTTFILLLAAPLINYLSFIVFPDGPLLFFSALFLLLYKRFLHEKNTGLAIVVGCTMALMLYAKYHGILVILFAFLAVPKMTLTIRFWIAAALGFLLFLPHLWWQYVHDFPTFQFHLSGRSDPFSAGLSLQYITQQAAAIGPGLIPVLFAISVRDPFERVLAFIIGGTLLFFLMSSFNTFIHFHWTSIAIFPLLYFACRYFAVGQHSILFKLLIIPFAVIILLARIFLLFDVGFIGAGEDLYHGREKWAKDISLIAGDRYVLFPNNLREAPLYSFYSGKTGVALYDRPEKKSQYELWNYEDSLQQKAVTVVTPYFMEGSRAYQTRAGEKMYYQTISRFSSYYNGISIKVAHQAVLNDSTAFHLLIQNNRKQPVSLAAPLQLIYTVSENRNVVSSGVLTQFTAPRIIFPGDVYRIIVHVPQQAFLDGAALYFGFRMPALTDSYNSKPISSLKY